MLDVPVLVTLPKAKTVTDKVVSALQAVDNNYGITAKIDEKLLVRRSRAPRHARRLRGCRPRMAPSSPRRSRARAHPARRFPTRCRPRRTSSPRSSRPSPARLTSSRPASSRPAARWLRDAASNAWRTTQHAWRGRSRESSPVGRHGASSGRTRLGVRQVSTFEAEVCQEWVFRCSLLTRMLRSGHKCACPLQLHTFRRRQKVRTRHTPPPRPHVRCEEARDASRLSRTLRRSAHASTRHVRAAAA